METIKTLENIFNFLNRIENKGQTLDEYLDSIINEKTINNQILTEQLILQEIIQYKTLLLLLKNKINYKTNIF